MDGNGMNERVVGCAQDELQRLVEMFQIHRNPQEYKYPFIISSS
jgi:hypothetical protein